MLQIKPMTIKDEAQVMEMVRDFYHTRRGKERLNL